MENNQSQVNRTKAMSSRLRIFVAIMAFLGFAGSGFAVDPPIGSPIGDPTVPPTDLPGAGGPPLSGIRSTQDSYGADGNLTVTGNVSGGRYFRYYNGIVPYRSTAEFYPSDFELAPGFGSTSLNSFIRRSAGSAYLDHGLGLNRPYYLPSQTVTSLTSGDQSQLASPLLPEVDPYPLYDRRRPLSRSFEELERIISREIQLQKESPQEEAPQEDKDTELEDIEAYLAQQLKKGEQKKEKGLFEDALGLPKPPESAKPLEPTSEQDTQKQAEEQPTDFYEQHRRETDKAEEEADALTADKLEETQDKQQDKSDVELKVGEKMELPEVDHAKAAAIRGPHETFKSWAQAKYTEYMQAAGKFLKEGKYYKAADAFTLAGVYSLKNPLPLGGKSLALFAAGEYMSSSFFLQKAIILSPDYAKRRINMVAVLVDKDMIQDRIIELATFQQKSKSPALAFLMAYMFYQGNNMAGAQQSIKLASEQMGNDPALISLKKAIEAAGAGAR